MAHDDDYLFALQLQNELDAEEESAADDWVAPIGCKKRKNDEIDNELNATQNLVHPDWENIDPTPDIYSLFGQFDIKFFQKKLHCVELEWSKRMYQCAGICYQRRNGLGMSIIIRLSEPLLKLRSRRDLIETMLHEMIHAYLFVLNIREGNGGHGPNFKRIMESINRTAGTNITVYHTFHDEVAMYKTHIWRCNGICQHRKPFYGWVKRTSNRAPGPNDNWWAKHHETCSGTFVKVSQPEPKTKAKKSKVEDNKLPKITNWLNSSQKSVTTNPPTARGGAGGSTKMNGGGTVVLKPTAKNRNSTQTSADNVGNILGAASSILGSVSDAVAGGNLRNVVGFRDLNDSGSSVIQRPTFQSGGFVLGSSSANSSATVPPAENIRNIWANKFTDKKSESPEPEKLPESVNRTTTKKPKVTESTSAWEEIDDDILIHSVKNTVIEIDDGSNDGFYTDADAVPVATVIQSTREMKSEISIKKELLDDLGEEDENIEMIDGEFDDALNESLDLLTDTSVIDEIFGTDTLMSDFNNINNVVMNDPENVGNSSREIVTCPICEDQMPRGDLTCHLDGCNGITVKVNPRKRGEKSTTLPFYKNHVKPSTSQASGQSKSRIDHSERELLLQAGYTQEQIDRLSTENREAKEYNDRIMDEMASEERRRRTTSVITQHTTNNDMETITLDDESNSAPSEQLPCPVCNTLVDANQINQHLDECLQGNV